MDMTVEEYGTIMSVTIWPVLALLVLLPLTKSGEDPMFAFGWTGERPSFDMQAKIIRCRSGRGDPTLVLGPRLDSDDHHRECLRMCSPRFRTMSQYKRFLSSTSNWSRMATLEK